LINIGEKAEEHGYDLQRKSPIMRDL
jgi:hypothetical protein